MQREVIKQLFMQHYAKMQRVARTLLYDEQESEDVVSDIFEKLLHGQITLMPGSEKNYLLTTVRNQCLKRLRHREIQRRTNEVFTDIQDESDAEDERLTDIVEFVVGHLSHQEQCIFHLRFTEGRSYEEIATTEHISRVSVWKHLSHIMTEIKSQFNQRKQ